MISIIIPAHNEEGYIGQCLTRIASSDDPGVPIEVIVVANGCSDRTADEAQAFAPQFDNRGWELEVLRLDIGGKISALNAGDAVARYLRRVYVDADVHVTPGLIAGLASALDRDVATFASGRPQIRKACTFVSERYARFWERLPFMREGVPGCGVYAVNASGRARWGEFPPVIADDTYARYHFQVEEMVGVEASYSWPITEGFGNLVRVRRRQDQGLSEIRQLYPELAAQARATAPGLGRKLGLLAEDPLGFAIYAAVAVAVRTPAFRNRGRWDRGR